jgi:hypothetical protein
MDEGLAGHSKDPARGPGTKKGQHREVLTLFRFGAP